MKLCTTLMLLALAACGTSVDVEEVCESLRDCPDGRGADCEDDGLALEAKAEEASCSDRFDAYLACLDEADCHWRNGCTHEREDLEGCIGALAP